MINLNEMPQEILANIAHHLDPGIQRMFFGLVSKSIVEAIKVNNENADFRLNDGFQTNKYIIEYLAETNNMEFVKRWLASDPYKNEKSRFVNVPTVYN